MCGGDEGAVIGRRGGVGGGEGGGLGGVIAIGAATVMLLSSTPSSVANPGDSPLSKLDTAKALLTASSCWVMLIAAEILCTAVALGTSLGDTAWRTRESCQHRQWAQTGEGAAV